MQPGDCPFCSKKIESSVFLVKGSYMALYNIAPVLPGHSLIVPKKHVTSILSLNKSELSDFFETAREALHILMKAFSTDAFDWSLQEKPEAGQTIEHLHLHLVPRLKNDLKRPGDWYPLVSGNDDSLIDSLNRQRLNEAALSQIITELKKIASSDL
ncbi:MAG TPA: HIT domain-containing protein [Bacteroidales bacterium]|jgi:bis(5'-adenosyl)-triphosphatase|nr:HIT domain-containing protein [Bacteroidales bacterium]